jgi:ribosomal protein S18 acetylase RimI-like enzyme
VVLPDLPAVLAVTDTTSTIRPARSADEAFLAEMLRLAAAWRDPEPSLSPEDVRRTPDLARYVQGWGRDDDGGVIAESPPGFPVGAAWFRLFPASARGFAFLDSRTPELSVAVLERARGRGIGTALVRAAVAEARSRGFPALSLSVERENPAARLYEREGFEVVRAGADTWTMRLDLART